MKKYLYLLLFIFIVGCSSADEEAIENPSALKDKIGDCTEEIKIVSAYGDDIRIRYPLGNEDDAEKVAREWCDVNGKVAVKTTVSCQGCCYSSYLCKE
mgnify:FL=1|tara:strand:- start:677 stop:970 length:294 start_codon:yes stop_codon:yes gene_type:complete